MEINEYNYEIENIKYPFLNVCAPNCQIEHYEVTQYSMNMVHSKYDYYNKIWETNKEKKSQTINVFRTWKDNN